MTESAFFIESTRVSNVNLSPKQKEVEQLPVGSRALVYGSPGSGKTTALRALYLAQISGDEPKLKAHQVLAIAGSREAANLLRDDLALQFQSTTAGPMARTLSSFAFQVLRHKALAEGTKTPELISGSEQDRMLAEIIKGLEGQDLQALGWPNHISANVFSLKGFRAELRDLITVCLEHRISPDDLAALGLENGRQDWVAASDLFKQYELMLAEPKQDNRHDSSTLLDVASRYLENGSGFTPEVDAIRLVLVDDAQELTPSARRLLAQLVSRGAGLVLFGDPDTATLGFRSGDARSMVSLMQEVGEQSPKQVVLSAPVGLRPSELSKALGNISLVFRPNKAVCKGATTWLLAKNSKTRRSSKPKYSMHRSPRPRG